MVQSIELLLDPDAEAVVRAAWTALAEDGLPSLASHLGETNRPHLTLLAAESGVEAAVPRLRAMLQGLDLPAILGAPLLFGGHRGRWVLTRQVVPTRALLDVQAEVHHLVVTTTDAVVQPHGAPDDWTPHVSISRRIVADQLARALAVLEAAPLPCRFVGARLWDSPSATVTDLSEPA